VRVECPPTHSEAILLEIQTAVRESIGLRIDVHSLKPGQLSHEIPEGFVKVPRWIDNRWQGSPSPQDVMATSELSK